MHKLYALFVIYFFYAAGLISAAGISVYGQSKPDTTQRVRLDSVTVTTDTRRDRKSTRLNSSH